MQFEVRGDKPIFLQLAEALEDYILKGVFPEETQIPSTTELAISLKLNPATTNRAVNLLVGEKSSTRAWNRNVRLLRRQGVIATKRQSAFFDDYVVPLIAESLSLGIPGKISFR
jgi:DNA-binding transcriptional regulator YhcF (GntR family)